MNNQTKYCSLKQRILSIKWIKIEILYAKKLQKEIQCLDLSDIDKIFDIEIKHFIQSNITKDLKCPKKN